MAACMFCSGAAMLVWITDPSDQAGRRVWRPGQKGLGYRLLQRHNKNPLSIQIDCYHG